MAKREGLELETEIRSDCAPLNGIVKDILSGGEDVHVLRDPTRGGVATTLKEIAIQSDVTITLHEASLPINGAVRSVCAVLGLDPLYVANEGKALVFAPPEAVDGILERMRRHPLGKGSAVIGEVTSQGGGKVRMETVVGGMRAVEMLSGEQLPRIC